MKKILFSLGLAFAAAAAFAGLAKADGTASYSVSGTYATGTISTPLTQTGPDFTMNFSLPTQPASLIISSMSGDDFYVYPLTVQYSNSNGTTTTNSTLLNVLVAFYTSTASSQSGGFFLDYCATDVNCVTGLEYQWTFAGPQQYTGSESNPTLAPTSFQFSGPFTVFTDTFSESDSTISGSVTGSATATPETGSLGMLMMGLAGLALIVKFKS